MKLTPLNISAIEAEYNTIVETLKKTNFNISKACIILQIDRKTFYNKLQDHKDAELQKQLQAQTA